MELIGNDRWRGTFTVASLGRYRYTVTAWVDAFLSWRHDFARRVEPEDLRIAARVGAELIAGAAQRAKGEDARQLAQWSKTLLSLDDPELLQTDSAGRVARRGRAALSRPPLRHDVPGRVPARRRSRARTILELVRDVPALRAASRPACTGRSTIARRVSPTSRRWDSMSSTCLRSIRSDACDARAPTMRWSPVPTTWEAPGRSARAKAGTRRSIPSSDRSRRSGA